MQSASTTLNSTASILIYNETASIIDYNNFDTPRAERKHLKKIKMAEENTDDIPTRRRPSRHRASARGKSGTTLASSFKQFVGSATSAEIEEFSTQLNAALNSVAIDDDETAAAVDSDQNVRAPQRRPSEGEFYAPQPTSRRNSKAGEQLVASMKQTAADLLAELDLSDFEEDDDDDKFNKGGLETLREESVRSM